MFFRNIAAHTFVRVAFHPKSAKAEKRHKSVIIKQLILLKQISRSQKKLLSDLIPSSTFHFNHSPPIAFLFFLHDGFFGFQSTFWKKIGLVHIVKSSVNPEPEIERVSNCFSQPPLKGDQTTISSLVIGEVMKFSYSRI